jgi:hypothetical protein
MVPPLSHLTSMLASLTMVPTCSRWRRAMPRSGTRHRPSTRCNAVVFGVGREALAAAFDEGQRPVEFVARQFA